MFTLLGVAESFGLIMSIIFFFGPLVVFLLVILPILIVNSVYKNFVFKHSLALRQLEKINRQYHFKRIPNFDMSHSYDNENFYSDISCYDYMVYQLVYESNKVKQALKDTLENKELYEQYVKQVDACSMDTYDTEELLRNRKKLKKYEAKLFLEKMLKPKTVFEIKVKLTLTDINGSYRTSKRKTFDAKTIKDAITELSQKSGSFYLNDNVWKSICRVERGKVTNRMRFSIYKRDHNRCRICGRRTGDLEVDHIIPIAKGGKSTYDNLQTLCHRCNVRKGANII